MNKKALPAILLVILSIACKKQGQDGLNSLIAMQSFLSNSSCPSGGLDIKSGLDINRNKILDSLEITETKFFCNGQSSTADKQILFHLDFSANTTSTNPVVGGELIKFSKRNYPNVDSIILVANPYVADATNTAIIELYNMTDNIPISSSTITSSNLYVGTNIRPYLQSGNLFNSLPDKEISLGISLKSGTAGKFAAAGNCFLILYRK